MKIELECKVQEVELFWPIGWWQPHPFQALCWLSVSSWPQPSFSCRGELHSAWRPAPAAQFGQLHLKLLPAGRNLGEIQQHKCLPIAGCEHEWGGFARMQMQASVAVCMCCWWPLGCRVGKDRGWQFWAVPELSSYTEFVIYYRRVSL